MRKIIVAGNWKMNLDFNESKILYSSIIKGLEESENLEKVMIFPPYPYLYPLSELTSNKNLELGSQNIASEISGAYTGEVSASMIKSLGIDHTLIGHSERRSYYGESHEVLKKKVDLALGNNLKIIFCCGESLDERKSDRHEDVIASQLSESLFHIDDDDMKNVIIAYEPVWAIGTGETASSQQAEDMHAFIRELLVTQFSDEIARNTHILYGGSCNAANSVELFNMPNVDGGLVGGASLKSEEFLKIISQLDA